MIEPSVLLRIEFDVVKRSSLWRRPDLHTNLVRSVRSRLPVMSKLHITHTIQVQQSHQISWLVTTLTSAVPFRIVFYHQKRWSCGGVRSARGIVASIIIPHRVCTLVWECCTRGTTVALCLFLHKFGMQILTCVWEAISSLIAVSWLVIRPQLVQEPLFRCGGLLSTAIVGTPASFPLFTSFALWDVFPVGHFVLPEKTDK